MGIGSRPSRAKKQTAKAAHRAGADQAITSAPSNAPTTNRRSTHRRAPSPRRSRSRSRSRSHSSDSESDIAGRIAAVKAKLTAKRTKENERQRLKALEEELATFSSRNQTSLPFRPSASQAANPYAPPPANPYALSSANPYLSSQPAPPTHWGEAPPPSANPYASPPANPYAPPLPPTLWGEAPLPLSVGYIDPIFIPLIKRFPAVDIKYITQVYRGTLKPQDMMKLSNCFVIRSHQDQAVTQEQDVESSALIDLLACFEVYGQMVCYFTRPIEKAMALQEALSSYRCRLIQYSDIYDWASVSKFHLAFLYSRITTSQFEPTGWLTSNRTLEDQLLVRHETIAETLSS